MTDYPIDTARHFAEGLGFPVLTTDVPAISAAVHRHYALGQRDAAHLAAGRVLAEREACAQVARQVSAKYAFGYYGNEVDTADEIERGILARTQP